MSASIYLADLRHNFGGVLSTDCMPLSVGYLKAVMDQQLPEIQSSLYAYPNRLGEAMRAQPPDVLMVGNYVWNEGLGRHYLRLAKQLNPGCLTVMGGPNIPNEPDRQISFLSNRPEIDVYILGEADFLATEVVREFLAAGCSVRAFGEREIPSSIYRRPDGSIVRKETWERKRNVNDIPSPWLTGIMDEFFDGKLAPMIETNRGCPFTCSFCVQGTKFYTKVNYFETDRLKEEIDYIGTRIHERSPSMGTLRIADANYGMYERDVELSEHIGRAQQRFQWPTFIDATTGKNRPERIIKSLEQVNGALVLYQAVQSLDENVLRNVKRSNIKLSAYEQINMYIRGRGLRSNSDLILGLPGESLDSHLAALRSILDTDINQMHCFQAMMLKGSEMEELATRQMFQFGTRFRVLPKNWGVYDDEQVFDIEEIIVETDTLPFEDYVQARKYHLTFSVFWNDNWFQHIIKLVRRFGISNFDWLSAMLKAMEADQGTVRQFLDEFEAETRNELFPTYEACAEFYGQPDNFQKLQRAEIGDNLMYKYRARASFFCWFEICKCAMDATRELLLERGASSAIPAFEVFWRDFHAYQESTHASGRSFAEISAPVEVELNHDIDAWIDAGLPDDIASFRLNRPTPYVFSLTPDGMRELRAALEVWSTSLPGLTKMVTRIRVTSQIRRCKQKDGGEGSGSELSPSHDCNESSLVNVSHEQIIR